MRDSVHTSLPKVRSARVLVRAVAGLVAFVFWSVLPDVSGLEVMLFVSILVVLVEFHSRLYDNSIDRTRSRAIAVICLASVAVFAALISGTRERINKSYLVMSGGSASQAPASGLAYLLAESIDEPVVAYSSASAAYSQYGPPSHVVHSPAGTIAIESVGYGQFKTRLDKFVSSNAAGPDTVSIAEQSTMTQAGLNRLLAGIADHFGIPESEVTCVACITEDQVANYHYFRGLGSYYQMTQEGLKNSVDHFHAALKREPDFSLARAGLAEASAQLVFRGWSMSSAQVDSAIVLAERAVKERPDLPQCHKALGICFVAKHAVSVRSDGRDYDDKRWLRLARKSTERAVELNKSYSLSLNNLSFIYAQLGELKLAESTCSRAISVSPGFYLPHINQANQLLKQGRYREALTSARHAIRLAPEHVGLGYFVLGFIYVKLGDFPTAALLLEGIERYSDFNYSVLRRDLLTDEENVRLQRELDVSIVGNR